MIVYVVMAETLYECSHVDSVWDNETDARKREAEIDNGAVPFADFGRVVEKEVNSTNC
jgi:hypothetical protein